MNIGKHWLVATVLGLCLLCCPSAQSTSWSSKDISSGPARGQYPLNVYGAGFDRNNRAFLCVFHPQSFSLAGLTTFSDSQLAQSSEADVLNNNTLNCIVPLWDYSGGLYSFSIFLNGFGLIPFENGPAAQSTFTFTEAWLSESGNNPTAGAAAGGSQFSFFGYGFDMSSSLYSCVFVRTGEVLSAPAVATSAKELTCGTPAWGQQYFGASDDGRVTFGIYSNVTIYLSKGGTEVLWLGESTGRHFGTSCMGRDCAEFLFFSVWSGLFLNETGSAYGVSIEGGYPFVVNGVAFSSSATYYCELRSSSGVLAYTSAQAPLSPTSIRFLTPSWPDAAGQMAVALFLSNTAGVLDTANDVLVRYSLSYPANISYDEAWTTVTPTAGLSQGGTQLLVAIEGLRPGAENRTYACRFDTQVRMPNCSVWDVTSQPSAICADGGIYLVAPAEVLSATQLGCSTPEWVLAAGTIPFTLLRRFDAQDAWHEAVHSGADLNRRFTFLEEWHGINGTTSTRLELGAQGGELFTVEGHGFDDSGSTFYSCVFQNLADTFQELTSAGTVLNPSTLQCVSPRWGFQYGEATVQLRIQHGNDPVYLTPLDDPTLTSDESCATARCNLDLYAMWDSRAPSPAFGCATGGSAVLMHGAGFTSPSSNGSTTYSCVFSSGTTQVSVPALLVNSTAVSCTTLPWTSPNLTAHFTLSNAVAINTPNLTAEFDFVACWLTKNASTGRARGGELLRLFGAGFEDALGTYSCLFSTGSGFSELSPASFVNTSELLCAVPEWLFEATDTNFFLVAGNASLLVAYDGLSSDPAALQFLFTSEWTAISPTVGPASGTTTIEVQGFGFAANK
eukprot:2133917-Rhodomonas_salina.1